MSVWSRMRARVQRRTLQDFLRSVNVNPNLPLSEETYEELRTFLFRDEHDDGVGEPPTPLWPWALAAIPCLAVGVLVVATNLSPWLAFPLFAVTTCAAMYLAGALSMKLGMARYIRTELRRRGLRVCAGCGYDLRGREEPRCPECGEAESAM
jgi:hypothetical protein